MANNVKNLGLDMGNSTICVAGINDKGEIIKAYTNSVYSMDTALISGDIIECKGVKLALGVGQTTLSNVDKTNREYIEQQILWAVHSLYGSGTYYINLGVGLPISIYKAKKEEFREKIKALGTIEGVVNGKEISVNLVDVKVQAEGYAALRILTNYIDKDNTTLIIDIGMKTTDVILIEWNGKFIISNYGTTNIALYDMYKVLQDKIASEGVEVTIEQIDKKLQSNKPIIRTEKGDFNLVEHLSDALHVCRDIMKDIENKFGKTILHDKIFVGGGAEKFLGAVEGKVKNNVEVEKELRWYGNAVGYLWNT
ncbi:ParM/StbA family protein [Zhenhengia yiwuensis]|uniref:ParM/StbA family protein n=1 Tax=Zhenhengia yiwuensis TaxID=2763666 RepID=A0A926EL02_9FIRM|nr:ParM/StbA family protein [Zhenhengia yiwuensis]MBC8579993.1 ParM/StbA family protein [Zhenhengia yiwuensis]